jgi:hypothetical protein
MNKSHINFISGMGMERPRSEVNPSVAYSPSDRPAFAWRSKRPNVCSHASLIWKLGGPSALPSLQTASSASDFWIIWG